MLSPDRAIRCDYHGEIAPAVAAEWELLLEPLASAQILSPSYSCGACLPHAATDHVGYVQGIQSVDGDTQVSLTIRRIQAVPLSPRPALYIVQPTRTE